MQHKKLNKSKLLKQNQILRDSSQYEITKEKLLERQEFSRALIDPNSINEEERSVEILISTETPLRRTDWWSGEQYDEVLLHSAENVDLTRASTAKLRWMHGSGKYGELPLGRLENVRIENKEMRAKAIFSEANPDGDMFWRMVLEGTLTEISVGGKKQDVRITERDGEVPLVEVIRWEFHEASLVDIGADPNAGIGRSENENEGDMMNKIQELRRELEKLRKDGASADEIQRKNNELETEIKRVSDENNNLKRVNAIKDLVRENTGVLDDDEVNRFIDDKTKTTEDVARALLDKKREEQDDVGFQRGQDTGDKNSIMRAVGDSLLMRFGVAVAEPHADAHKYTGASMLEVARAITGYDGFDREELIKRAMSTSDFPILLSNMANKVLIQAFDEESGTIRAWTAEAEVKDFKQGAAAHMKSGGRLQKLAEKGELKKTEFTEDGEYFKLETYGIEVSVTRQMLINDDMGAFQNLIKEFGEMARRTENGIGYDLLQGKGDFTNAKMRDGKAIFHSTHNNLDATGSDISTTSISAARTKMRRQKDHAGNKLNISPKYLIVSPENETVALQHIQSEADPSSSNSGVKNPHRNTVEVVVESELDAAPWYMASNRRTIKRLYLQGSGKKPQVAEKSRTLTGVTFECIFDFAVYAEDFRGLYKNPGL